MKKGFLVSSLCASLASLTSCDNPSHNRGSSDIIKKTNISPSFFSNRTAENADTQKAQKALFLSCSHILDHENREITHQKCVDTILWKNVCLKVNNLLQSPLSNGKFIAFLKENFDAISLEKNKEETGFMTGYFQPELKASLTKSDIYKYPIYRHPDDLILIPDLAPFTSQAKGIRIAGRLKDNKLIPYATRSDINAGYLEGRNLEIAYVKDPIDLFFMHIQGSGKLIFENGHTQTLFYAATNGKAYKAIGKFLIDQGFLDSKTVTMATIKHWLRHNPDQAQDILNKNESYVFYQKAPSECHENPLGAQNTPLTPFASVATDPHYLPIGSLLWIKTDHPQIASRFVVAQDVGGAIKGPLRADFYCGSGVTAGNLAGALKQNTKFVVLRPKK